MKNTGLFLSLFCYLLTDYANAATIGEVNNSASQHPQTYFLTEPTPTPQSTTLPQYPSRINSTAQPYNNTYFQNQNRNQSNAVPTYPIPAPPSYPSPNLNAQYAPPAYQAPAYQTPTYDRGANLAGNTQNPQKGQAASPQNGLGCNQAYEGYRYTGQGLQDSDPCCDQEPADQACGDSYSLFCHYRPCNYYTTECVYVPRYEYLKCCRYVPQYYNETRCRKVPQYYKVMKQKIVQEPYCIMRCSLVEQYNTETCCCETVPMYYPETCYRDVPQYYEETCCREVPQYYEETCCRHVPQYYYTCQCKYCPEYKYKRHCKYIPQYYYKHETNRNSIGMQGPDCCETP